MPFRKRSCGNSHESDNSGAVIGLETNPDDMTKEDRRRIVLLALADHGWAMPPSVIFRNLKFHQDITFEQRSLTTYLDEFVEEGLVRRIDPKKLPEKELTDLDEGSDRRAWYIITEDGRDYLYS